MSSDFPGIQGEVRGLIWSMHQLVPIAPINRPAEILRDDHIAAANACILLRVFLRSPHSRDMGNARNRASTIKGPWMRSP